MAPTKADLHACLLQSFSAARLVALLAAEPGDRPIDELMVRARQAIDGTTVEELPLLVAALASLVPKHKFHAVKKTERAAAGMRNAAWTALQNQFLKETHGQ